MAEDTAKVAETVVEQTPKNEAPPATPVAEKKPEDVELEELRKEKEQLTMRNNQLTNRLKAKEEAEADADAKRLEEKEEYKTLYEQEKAKREEVESVRDAEKHEREVRKASKNVLADYSDEVKAIAEDTGLRLSEITEEAATEFKGKLDKIQSRLGGVRVTPNNPGSSSPKEELTRDQLRETLNDPIKRDAYYRKNSPVTAGMMAPES